MMKNMEKALEDFLDDDIQKDKEKSVKSDYSIIERVDKIIIEESGKQLLREQY
jgi:hypothetical protein